MLVYPPVRHEHDTTSNFPVPHSRYYLSLLYRGSLPARRRLLLCPWFTTSCSCTRRWSLDMNCPFSFLKRPPSTLRFFSASINPPAEPFWFVVFSDDLSFLLTVSLSVDERILFILALILTSWSFEYCSDCILKLLVTLFNAGQRVAPTHGALVTRVIFGLGTRC